MSEERKTVLEAADISIVFGGLTAVSNFSCTLKEGELIGLIGPNGAGKTTIFNMLSGVYTPTSGQISFWDKKGRVIVTNKKSPAQLNIMGIARTFQNIRLFSSQTVADNVRIALHNQRIVVDDPPKIAGRYTQNVVERKLKAEGLSRNDLGREKFLERTWQVKEEHHNIIVKQQKKLGNSTDWDRERFTYDEGLSGAVRDVFVTLYERGLMYKGKRLVRLTTLQKLRVVILMLLRVFQNWYSTMVQKKYL